LAAAAVAAFACAAVAGEVIEIIAAVGHVECIQCSSRSLYGHRAGQLFLILIIFICQPLVAATHSPTTSANKMERKQDRTAQDSSVCFVRRWIAEYISIYIHRAIT